jgi:hypothetical protein
VSYSRYMCPTIWSSPHYGSVRVESNPITIMVASGMPQSIASRLADSVVQLLQVFGPNWQSQHTTIILCRKIY